MVVCYDGEKAFEEVARVFEGHESILRSTHMGMKAALMMYTAEFVPLSGHDARATSLGPWTLSVASAMTELASY